MQTPNPTKATRAEKRRAAEAIIARYPTVRDAELERLFDFFRRDSSALDRRLIATNRRIRPQYRQLCRDHHIHRLPWVDTAVVVLGAVLGAGGLLYLVTAS